MESNLLKWGFVWFCPQVCFCRELFELNITNELLNNFKENERFVSDLDSDWRYREDTGTFMNTKVGRRCLLSPSFSSVKKIKPWAAQLLGPQHMQSNHRSGLMFVSEPPDPAAFFGRSQLIDALFWLSWQPLHCSYIRGCTLKKCVRYKHDQMCSSI